jgi:methylated-DNA-protein-cysteine methyltransferase related protein
LATSTLKYLWLCPAVPQLPSHDARGEEQAREKGNRLDPLHSRIIKVLRRLPRGKVATYGQIGALAGNPHAARQVVWVLHTHAEKLRLPWFRVINSKGIISLPKGEGFELQRARLKKEGVKVAVDGTIDLERYQWRPKISSLSWII